MRNNSFFIRIWRYLNYDMVDTCILSMFIVFLIRIIMNGITDDNILNLAGISFGIVYTSGMIYRNGWLKDIMNDWIKDESIRKSLYLYIYANRFKPFKRDIVSWIYFILWTGILIYAILILP